MGSARSKTAGSSFWQKYCERNSSCRQTIWAPCWAASAMRATAVRRLAAGSAAQAICTRPTTIVPGSDCVIPCSGPNPDVTIDESVSVLRQANLSFPRTRESRRGEANGCTGMDARFRGHDDSGESLRPQPMTLGKRGAEAGAPALARLGRLSVLQRFVSSRLADRRSRQLFTKIARAQAAPRAMSTIHEHGSRSFSACRSPLARLALARGLQWRAALLPWWRAVSDLSVRRGRRA